MDIDNVVIYVADAVRYDTAVEQDISEIGAVYKTIASSLHTPTSFASIVSGLYPPSHGVEGFQHQLCPDTQTLLNLPKTDCAISPSMEHHPVTDVLRNPPSKDLERINSPYVYLIRDPAGHAPYNQFDWEEFTRQQTSEEYFDSVSSIQQMREDYQNAVSGSIDRFQNLIQQAKDYNVTDNTLFVYLGDHGERVGEYGYVGHNHLARPESVYVPTLFYHKDIDPGRRDGCIRHIDIAPTVCELLGIQTKKMDGDSIKIGEEVYRPGYNQYESVFYSSTRLDSRRMIQSYWDHDGGFVKTKGGYLKALIIYGYLRWNMSPNRFIGGDGFRSTFSEFSPGMKKYGNPSISLDECEKIFEQFQKRQNTGEEKVDQETVDQLESLGYM